MRRTRQARARADLAAAAFNLQRLRLSASSHRMAAQLERRKPGLLIGGGLLSGILMMAPTRDLAHVVTRVGGVAALILRSPLLNAVLIPVWQIAWPAWSLRSNKVPGARPVPSQSSDSFP